MPGCLATVGWKISYGPADDRLRELYIPALSRSIAYARTAGFFSSGALAIAAAGLASLIRAGGRMRLLVGAALSEEDVRAIERGEDALGQAVEQRLLEVLASLERDPTDPARRRLEALAWMVAHGALDIRVVLPTGPDGRPLPAHQAADYFHPKEGLLTDPCGHQLAFSGSANETPSGWLHNYEQFMVYTSWESSRPYLLQVAERIERLWQGREEGWRALPVPEAVRERLIRLAPDEPPGQDPLEVEVASPAPRAIPSDQRERILFQFLRDGPLLPGGDRLGIQTAGIRPWPHQARIVREVVRRFPERFLLADEVGLGKTVEAGLVLRALLLSREVRRCLILVPRSVLRQWQEELYEKFALNIPRYDGAGFHDYFGEIPAPPGNPWNAYPVLLASSQLAKGRDRVQEVLAADPWDLVIVDEAHHARRREFRTERYRPNRLLALLEGDGQSPGLAGRTRGLLLLTATPLQLHPVEVFDLLRQLQLPGAWAASERRFLRFFDELRAARAGQPVDWALLLRLAAAALDGTSLEALVGGAARERVGVVEWDRIGDLLAGRRPPETAASLSPSARAVLLEACRRASPLGQRMFRTTREQLRRYHRQGLLAEPVPTRDPRPRWIPMTAEEWGLYQRVEDYVADFYHRYEGERKGLGFIMTVYRRRLTSSFAALARSLERRRAYLLELRGPAFGLTDEDTEEADLDEDVAEDLESDAREGRLPPGLQRLLEGELRAVEEVLDQVRRLGADTKFQALVEDLRALLAQRDRVAIFTHYTDTMDAIRERLVGLYGRRLACYSGRGGERWDGARWVEVSKEQVKEAFRTGDLQVLLCTEAASEGLNLQTCGVLINYDMPWNPMRVEQRIGRFDRIGQHHPDVWIRHYFVVGPGGEPTVEARVYKALEARIGWFRAVVGELQPILARIPSVIEEAVTARHADRAPVLDRLIAELQHALEEQEASALSLDDAAEPPPIGDEGPAPLTLPELEAALRTSSLGGRFTPHREIAGAFELDLRGRLWEVTFDPAIADAHPGRVRLLTPGEALLNEVLELVEPPVGRPAGHGLVRVTADRAVRWYRPGPDRAELVSTLRDLRSALEGLPSEVTPSILEQATREIHSVTEAQAHRAEIQTRRHAEDQRAALEERARLTLAAATACRMVLDGIKDLETAWRLVVSSGYPFAGLARLVGQPASSDVQSEAVGLSGDQARRRLERAAEVAKELLRTLARPGDPDAAVSDPRPEARVEVYGW
ncbi:MAG TPA: helicase-related protein [Dehalococcoidia bacterium]|nr:helicase-related protein [Dehalococcoidia bacterium]